MLETFLSNLSELFDVPAGWMRLRTKVCCEPAHA